MPASRKRRIPVRLANIHKFTRRASLLALLLLQTTVLLTFIAEKDIPPTSRGLFRNLYVDHRHHLVYAYLALIILAPLLTLAHQISTPHKHRRRTLIYLTLIWALYVTLLTTQIPQKFAAVAEVTWHYLIEPQLNEMVIDE